jgi:hypothetical protein
VPGFEGGNPRVAAHRVERVSEIDCIAVAFFEPEQFGGLVFTTDGVVANGSSHLIPVLASAPDSDIKCLVRGFPLLWLGRVYSSGADRAVA